MFSAENITHRFLSAEPFPHLVIDNFMPEEFLRRVGAEFSTVNSSLWHCYAGHDEAGKSAFNKMDANMPPSCMALLAMLTHQTAASVCAAVTGIEGLTPDADLYGGGLHETHAGGFLGVHIDNERHPKTHFARRLNLIIYCTEGWQEEWGGHLELWDRSRSRAVARIAPLFNRAVLFETCAYSYHGHPEPLKCPDGITRKSIAVYYWSEPRSRARFVRKADEPYSADVEAQRAERSRIGSFAQ